MSDTGSDTAQVDVYGKKIWDYMLMHQDLAPADAIFALGSRDIRVAERATDLYLQGFGKLLIFAGNNGSIYGKDIIFDRPEADMFADVARKKGVPEEKILIENKSTNTGENILLVKSLLEEREISVDSFILVQKPYMERRTYATFRKQWPEVSCVVTSPDISYEDYATDEDYKDRWIDLMVGDLQRIKEYPAKGFQIPQEIPDDVWAAYEALVALGHTRYVMST